MNQEWVPGDSFDAQWLLILRHRDRQNRDYSRGCFIRHLNGSSLTFLCETACQSAR
jgi:hypothetical protein